MSIGVYSLHLVNDRINKGKRAAHACCHTKRQNFIVQIQLSHTSLIAEKEMRRMGNTHDTADWKARRSFNWKSMPAVNGNGKQQLARCHIAGNDYISKMLKRHDHKRRNIDWLYINK